ncbi:hypothetical protein WISP_99873 [Willisornis vidua]|uniref:Uncharacterized protein n=1 Tax=Willisornis vidua TaxID=1566151 RepID=A0ABQ9D4Z9_9PASS|nr:hypothetical protein WISP_99873 [Willisornis vidua]
MALLKQDHTELIAQDHVQTAFEYPQSQKLHHPPKQPVPVLSHPHIEEVFPNVQMEPLQEEQTCLVEAYWTRDLFAKFMRIRLYCNTLSAIIIILYRDNVWSVISDTDIIRISGLENNMVYPAKWKHKKT